MVTPVRAGYLDGISRFDALSRVIGHWLRCARLGECSISDAWEAVEGYNQSRISPPWPPARLRQEFEALRLHDLHSHDHQEAGGLSSDDGLNDLPAPRFSDDALAAAFVGQNGLDWRHVACWNAWYVWNGTCWQHETQGRIREVIRHVCRAAARKTDGGAEKRRIASLKTYSAVEKVISSDPAIAANVDQWDQKIMLLATPAGTIDLETGETCPASREDYATQSTTTSPGSHCPRWERFIATVTSGDLELQGYLQRLAGYCLTGSTAEQVFVFLYGSGGNGKSVFLQTIARVLGDYAATATLDTFMVGRSDRHLSELAGLRAARLVLVPETEAGRSWAEARIKAITGGEQIRANFMHRDYFEFTPRFKLIVAGNHRPSLTNVGEAMRRRLHLVPFLATIPENERDKGLTEALLEERDGILGWMVKGCADWQKIGLAPPDCVLSASRDYFSSEDIIGQWISECCQVDRGCSATAQALYKSWSHWAESGGYLTGSKKALGEALRERGFAAGKMGEQRGWCGIALRSLRAGAEVSE